ncbi:MAG TPA: hypothetical protein VGC66_12860 [Pyrinomonadaceae bacterium]|jgi:hypothetical protein
MNKFWILDFGFWIGAATELAQLQPRIANLKSKIQNNFEGEQLCQS